MMYELQYHLACPDHTGLTEIIVGWADFNRNASVVPGFLRSRVLLRGRERYSGQELGGVRVVFDTVWRSKEECIALMHLGLQRSFSSFLIGTEHRPVKHTNSIMLPRTKAQETGFDRERRQETYESKKRVFTLHSSLRVVEEEIRKYAQKECLTIAVSEFMTELEERWRQMDRKLSGNISLATLCRAVWSKQETHNSDLFLQISKISDKCSFWTFACVLLSDWDFAKLALSLSTKLQRKGVDHCGPTSSVFKMINQILHYEPSYST